MSEYRFHLQKYRPGSKTTCPNCGKSRCFVRYIDEQGSISFPGNVGKCDHENSCGYHYTPKEYFKDNPDVLEMESVFTHGPLILVWLHSALLHFEKIARYLDKMKVQ